MATNTKTAREPATNISFPLTKDNVFQAYKDADTYTQLLNDPFPEFSRIASNKPYAGLKKKFPRIAEGSTAAYIKQKPRALIQKTPGGNVTSEDGQEWLQLVAQWALDFEIIPNANEDYPVFEKAQNALEQAFTVGFSCTTAPFYNHNGIWSPDMMLNYWGDVIVPAGYKSIKAMPYVFLRGWWPKERLDSLLSNPQKAQQGGWDVANLQQVKTNLSTKDVKAETPVEKTRGLPENYVVIVVAYQKGVKAPLFTFNPDASLILRTKENPDPRGHKNIQTLYGLIDGTNPFGMSVIEIVGAWQNLMDNDVQAYQYNRAYNIDPALKKIGNIGDGDLHPGAQFEIATPDEGDIATIPLDTEALSSFPTTYEWQRSVLLGLLNSPTSAGVDANDAPLGKTPAGIAKAANIISTDDLTYVTHVHNWFQEWSETAINIYFAERKGKQALKLDQTTADQLRALAESDSSKFDSSLLKGNILTFDFDQPLPIFRFKVDGSSSKIQDEASQLQALEGILNLIKGDPDLRQLVGEEKIALIYNKIIAIAGIHDSAELAIDIAQLKQELEQQQSQQEAEQQRIAETVKAPNMSMPFKDMPGYGKLQMALMGNVKLRPQDVGLQPDLSPIPQPPTAVLPTKKGISPAPPTIPQEFTQAVATLQQAGLPEILIPHAIQALTEGVPLEDIIKSVQHPAIAQLHQKPEAVNG